MISNDQNDTRTTHLHGNNAVINDKLSRQEIGTCHQRPD